MHSPNFSIFIFIFSLLILWNHIFLLLQLAHQPLPWIPPLVSPKKAAKFYILNSSPYWILTFFLGGGGCMRNWTSTAPSSHFLIQIPLKYSPYALFLLLLLPFPSTQRKLTPFSLKPSNNIHAAKSTGSFVLTMTSISMYFELPGRGPDKWTLPSKYRLQDKTQAP